MQAAHAGSIPGMARGLGSDPGRAYSADDDRQKLISDDGQPCDINDRNDDDDDDDVDGG